MMVWRKVDRLFLRQQRLIAKITLLFTFAVLINEMYGLLPVGVNSTLFMVRLGWWLAIPLLFIGVLFLRKRF